MILKVLELEDFNFDPLLKYINSGVFIDSVNNYEIQAGCDLSILKDNIIKHFLIYEEIFGHFFIHNVLTIKDEPFVISTKCKNKDINVRKIYTENIHSFLVLADIMESVDLLDVENNTKHPFEIIEDFYATVILNDIDSNVPYIFYDIYEHSKLNQELLDKYFNNTNKHLIGYIDDGSTLDKLFSFIGSLKFLRENTYHNKNNNSIDKYIKKIDSFYNHRLPYENKLCINDPKLFNIINKLKIYYKNNNENTAFDTRLNINEYPFKNFPVIDFLKYCDLYLPTDMLVEFNNNVCTKFINDDEYFNTLINNFNGNYYKSVNYPAIPDYNKLKEMSLNCFTAISDLLGIIRYKTSISTYNYPKIKVTKSNDTFIELVISNDLELYKVSWDLTLLQLCDPTHNLISIQ